MGRQIIASDVRRLAASAPAAREEMEFAVTFYMEISHEEDDWEGHRRFVAFAVYLARLDYEIKVLLSQFLSDPDNRSVWEGQLLLLIHGALDHVRKAVGAVVRDLNEPESVSNLDIERVRDAARAFKKATRQIESDRTFQKCLNLVRNGVVAHHGFDKERDGEEAVAWVHSGMVARSRGYRPQDSQTAEYAVVLGRAVQELGAALVSREPSSTLAPC